MESISIGRYVAIFTGAFVAAIVAVLLVVALTNYEPHGSIGLVEMLFASFFTGMLFVKHNKRVSTVTERRRLVWLSFVASLLVVAVPIGGFLLYLGISFGLDDLMQGVSETMPKLPVFVWAIIVVVTLGLTYASLYFGYGYFTTRFGNHFLKKDGL